MPVGGLDGRAETDGRTGLAVTPSRWVPSDWGRLSGGADGVVATLAKLGVGFPLSIGPVLSGIFSAVVMSSAI